jgi:hypothetical protein
MNEHVEFIVKVSWPCSAFAFKLRSMQSFTISRC